MDKIYGISRRMYDKFGKEIVFSRGNSCCVYDIDDRKYIDMILGYGPIILGHGNEKYALAMKETLLDGTTFPSYGKKQLELAQCIQQYYSQQQLIAVYQSGSDTLDAALKICRYITGKRKFIRFGYIGWHDQLISDGLNWHEPINSHKYNQCVELSGKVNKDAINWDGKDMKQFDELCNQKDIACLIVDAYQVKRHKDVSLDYILTVCKGKDILVVLDETKTAGRVTPFGYYKDKIKSDFTVLGKAIGNGFPVSLLLASKKYGNLPYDSFKIAGTYARDTLGCEAVLTTHKIMNEINGYEIVSKTGREIAGIMNTCLEEIIGTKDIQVNVLLDGGILEFVYSDKLVNCDEIRNSLANCLLENQIILPNGHCFYVCTEHRHILEELKKHFKEAVFNTFRKMSSYKN